MFCKEKIFRAVILILLFTIFTLFSAISYVNAVSSDIADGVFRLHVIANSEFYLCRCFFKGRCDEYCF